MLIRLKSVSSMVVCLMDICWKLCRKGISIVMVVICRFENRKVIYVRMCSGGWLCSSDQMLFVDVVFWLVVEVGLWFCVDLLLKVVVLSRLIRFGVMKVYSSLICCVMMGISKVVSVVFVGMLFCWIENSRLWFFSGLFWFRKQELVGVMLLQFMFMSMLLVSILVMCVVVMSSMFMVQSVRYQWLIWNVLSWWMWLLNQIDEYVVVVYSIVVQSFIQWVEMFSVLVSRGEMVRIVVVVKDVVIWMVVSRSRVVKGCMDEIVLLDWLEKIRMFVFFCMVNLLWLGIKIMIVGKDMCLCFF